MDWDYPSFLGLTILSLAAFRVWRIFAEDSILERPRQRMLASAPRRRYAEWAICPWCLGFWVVIAWWLFWVAWHRWTLVIATPFALSAIVGLVASNIDPAE